MFVGRFQQKLLSIDGQAILTRWTKKSRATWKTSDRTRDVRATAGQKPTASRTDSLHTAQHRGTKKCCAGWHCSRDREFQKQLLRCRSPSRCLLTNRPHCGVRRRSPPTKKSLLPPVFRCVNANCSRFSPNQSPPTSLRKPLRCPSRRFITRWSASPSLAWQRPTREAALTRCSCECSARPLAPDRRRRRCSSG